MPVRAPAPPAIRGFNLENYIWKKKDKKNYIISFFFSKKKKIANLVIFL